MKAVYHGVTVMIGILLLCGGGNGADAFGFYGGAFPNRNRTCLLLLLCYGCLVFCCFTSTYSFLLFSVIGFVHT